MSRVLKSRDSSPCCFYGVDLVDHSALIHASIACGGFGGGGEVQWGEYREMSGYLIFEAFAVYAEW